MMKQILSIVLCTCCITCWCAFATAQAPGISLHDPSNLADNFYENIHASTYWYNGNEKQTRDRKAILNILDGAAYLGLNKVKYDFPKEPASDLSGEQASKYDRQFTTALIAFSTDLLQGAGIQNLIANDEVSGRFKTKTDSAIQQWVMHIPGNKDIASYLSMLEPDDKTYRVLKKGLRSQIDSGNRKKVTQLTDAINLYRWIAHFHFNKYVVVNIPAASLTLFDDTIHTTMKVVVGKPATRTPRFSTWCNQIVLYPYWNVPSSIARKELLPQFRRSPAKVDAMNMQILNAQGKIVDPYTINWQALSSTNFPYRIRQCTGCDNALGVIKFNLTDPFNVYLHDTNFKLAFMSDKRYLSHGCIRVSEPVELGNLLLGRALDTTFLKACLKKQEPVAIDLKTQVPVFVIYSIPSVSGDTMTYYRDVYRLYN